MAWPYRPATAVSAPPPIDPAHARPPGVDDRVVKAVGQLTEALEKIERARGRLYDFHQLVGAADCLLDHVVAGLRETGHHELADHIEQELIGRNVLPGRWTFQIVEEFDEGYYAVFRAEEERVRNALLAGHRHVWEAELKQRRRTWGRPGHEARPEPEPSGDGARSRR